MQKRRLGNSGLEIPPLMFGGNVLGWTADEATSFKLLDRFVAAGFDAIDTADVYSRWAPGHTGGESEIVLGRWLAKRGGRDKVSCIILGGGENDAKVHEWLATAASVPGFVGFAVGRTVFWQPLVDWRAKKITREQAVDQMAKRYREFVDIFEARH